MQQVTRHGSQVPSRSRLSNTPTWFVCIASFLISTAATAADDAEPKASPPDDDTPTIISTTRTRIPYRDAASSATVIGEQELEALATPLVTDALFAVPGLDVRRNGPPGQTTSLFLRGTNDNQVKFMLDGIDVTDPTTPTGTPLLDHLLSSGIGQVEVIRGPQSTLYGSDSVGGAINLITRTARSGPPTGSYEVEAGSFYTVHQRLTAEAGNQHFNTFFALSNLESQGLSASSAGSERDPYRNTHFATRLGFTPTEEFSTDVVLHYIRAQAEFDDAGADNPFNETESEQLFFKVEPKLYLADGRWVSTLNLNAAVHDRDTTQFSGGTFFDFLFDGAAYEADWQNDIALAEWNLLTVGAAYRYERSESASDFGSADNDRDIASVYLQDQVRLFDDRIQIIPGIRYDRFSDFGSHTTWRIAASYRHTETDTTLRGSFGTGFNAPSLFQLFDPFSGDPTLDAERSEGYDAGIDQRFWDGKAAVGVTYFHNDIDELIDFDFNTFTYTQTGAAETQGVEVFGVVQPWPGLTIRPSYTYTDTENLRTGDQLLRRPRHKAAVQVIYTFLDEKARLGLGVHYIGERDDVVAGSFPGVVTTNDDYFLVRLGGSYKVNDHLEVTARVENLLDEEYEDVLGFTSPGAAAYAGVKITIP